MSAAGWTRVRVSVWHSPLTGGAVGRRGWAISERGRCGRYGRPTAAQMCPSTSPAGPSWTPAAARTYVGRRRPQIPASEPVVRAQPLESSERPRRDRAGKLFSRFNIRPAVLENLARRFPHVRHTTAVQTRMLANFQDQTSLVAKAPPGSGKSLALALWLLCAPRLRRPLAGTTSVLLVPTKELAFQYVDWIAGLLGDAPIALPQVVQVVYRGPAAVEQAQIATLRTHPAPHILVATPARLLDILASADRDAVQLEHINTLAVDEADAVVRPLASDASKREVRQYRQHPPAGHRLIDHMVRARRVALTRAGVYVPLQFVAVSALLNSRLRRFCELMKWTTPELHTDVYGLGGRQSWAVADTEFCCVVYDPAAETLADLDAAALYAYDGPDPAWLAGQTRSVAEQVADAGAARAAKAAPAGFATGPGHVDYEYVVAVARVHGIDFVKRGLVVIPPSASRSAVVDCLRDFGISAAVLQLSAPQTLASDEFGPVDLRTLFADDAENAAAPDLVVAHAPQVRGLDLPGLRRVYVLAAETLDTAKELVALGGRCKPATAAGAPAELAVGDRGRVYVVGLANGRWPAQREAIVDMFDKLQIPLERFLDRRYE
ncbi:P-loop containing nucleoside triphosphate hydrolase protein [Dipodascopsis tothii]|uniref:P-loop containing nucleoside triphosphate hydrolase protein n=1 Tax=Dipodascopsis tothii TaxID=44089 RepID=UPI0034D011A3